MSLADLILSIADNKQMLGLRYAEWATRAPSLEADIAAAKVFLEPGTGLFVYFAVGGAGAFQVSANVSWIELRTT